MRFIDADGELKARMWDELSEVYGVSEESLQLVTTIAGYSTDTLRMVLEEVADGENEFSWERRYA